MTRPPETDRQLELQHLLDIHRQSVAKPAANHDAGDAPIVLSERFGGMTDLNAADRHTGSGNGSETRPEYPSVY